MIIYRIYEIPSYVQPDGSIGKVGCTLRTIEARALEQFHTDVNLLEEHTDIYVASDREIQLQKDYGYKVDKIPYWKTIENNSKGGWSQAAWDAVSIANTGRIPEHLKTKKHQSKAGKAGGKVVNVIKVTCKKCGVVTTPSGMGKHLKNPKTCELQSNVDVIKAEYSKVKSYRKLADKYNVSVNTIVKIIKKP